MTTKIFVAQFEKGASARTVRMKITSDAVDRDRDVIDPRGWQTRNYMKNPIVLWGHDKSIPAIARTVTLRAAGDALIADCEFPPEGIHPLADTIYALATLGFLHSASVGFLPVKYVYNAQRDGLDIDEAELLEWSFVNVPSNAEALIQRCLDSTCDRLAVETWAKSAKGECGCGCSDGDRLEIADSDLRLDIADEPPVLAIAGEYFDTDDLAFVGPRLARDLGDHVRQEARKAARSAINYMRGRIDD